MTAELAPIPQLILQRGNKVADHILFFLLGVMGLSLLAQIAIPLPWTPVPITGQTFGVAIMALLWGRRRATVNILSYLFLGALGLPIFALGKSGFSLGPTSGYLVGMVLASFWMGTMADKGFTRTWLCTYLIAASGSLITFICGVAWLSQFISKENLFTAGVLPFLPGDLLKTLLASFIASKAQQRLYKKL